MTLTLTYLKFRVFLLLLATLGMAFNPLPHLCFSFFTKFYILVKIFKDKCFCSNFIQILTSSFKYSINFLFKFHSKNFLTFFNFHIYQSLNALKTTKTTIITMINIITTITLMTRRTIRTTITIIAIIFTIFIIITVIKKPMT
jgi:hypothetical protein